MLISVATEIDRTGWSAGTGTGRGREVDGGGVVVERGGGGGGGGSVGGGGVRLFRFVAYNFQYACRYRR